MDDIKKEQTEKEWSRHKGKEHLPQRSTLTAHTWALGRQLGGNGKPNNHRNNPRGLYYIEVKGFNLLIPENSAN
jgi:hypothetical protein